MRGDQSFRITTDMAMRKSQIKIHLRITRLNTTKLGDKQNAWTHKDSWPRFCSVWNQWTFNVYLPANKQTNINNNKTSAFRENHNNLHKTVAKKEKEKRAVLLPREVIGQIKRILIIVLKSSSDVTSSSTSTVPTGMQKTPSKWNVEFRNTFPLKIIIKTFAFSEQFFTT